ncbi:hypothetical protein GCM10017620_26060 [Brevundimonas intermedia]|uniref:Uncharacterized protein n=1 Tax=Brevundimonas intermedia TaxID=74315 RepID=A0ABQ5TEK4_9CAUL|nr:hypothetical protein [Brevundimonas intermedia]GLK49633.1 hypothetical protein GCM10017620_26060 [Brevundimonas intermedia]
MLGLFDSLFAFKVHRVPSGTTIKDPESGDELEVTETSAVFSRWACWVTIKQYDAIVASTASEVAKALEERK